jgi:hypothetical protein
VVVVHKFDCTFFWPKSFCQSQNVTAEKLLKSLSHEKCAREMLINLTPERVAKDVALWKFQFVINLGRKKRNQSIHD